MSQKTFVNGFFWLEGQSPGPTACDTTESVSLSSWRDG